MPDERQTALLKDLLESARRIRTYLSGVDRAAFLSDLEKQDAVLRRLEVIGEAASRLSAETQARLPELPIRSMKGMRNITAHEYGEVDIEQVWKTAAVDVLS